MSLPSLLVETAADGDIFIGVEATKANPPIDFKDKDGDTLRRLFFFLFFEKEGKAAWPFQA
eukprot:7376589-Ditylum_brightwellii.AAC.1